MIAASTRALLSLLVLTVSTAACTDISEEESRSLSSSGAVLVNVTSEPIAFRYPELPERQTVAEGAAAGAAAGAAETAVMTLVNPFTVVYLPVMLTLGALDGVDSVYSDEQWEQIATYHQTLKQVQLRLYPDLQNRDLEREIERNILRAFSQRSESCVTTTRRAENCRNWEPKSTVSVRLAPELTSGGYVLRTSVALSLPGAADIVCIKRDFNTSYIRSSDERISVEGALNYIGNLHQAFGRQLAFELYEAPIRLNDPDFADARMLARQGIGMVQEGELPCLHVALPEG